MFLDEDIDYAQALLAAGVACELHVYPGAFHGSSSLVPDADVSRRWHRDEMAALNRALNGSALVRDAIRIALAGETEAHADPLNELAGSVDVEPDDDLNAVIYGTGT